MKCLILILMVAMLSACGQQQDVSKSSLDVGSDKIEGPIIMSQGVTVDVSGVCSFNTEVGRIELILCGDNTSEGLSIIPDWQLRGYSFSAEVFEDRIVIDIVYRDDTGIYPGDPNNMTGRLEIRGVYE